ncbi:uncharacterized protein METZ01_LOCUS461182 [marine metagenome]|uniref:Uncharacterized protein n=1 Tax=marine metagenome TaxID=408172 RepID=A0A383AMK2_9ZZZZ
MCKNCIGAPTKQGALLKNVYKKIRETKRVFWPSSMQT